MGKKGGSKQKQGSSNSKKCTCDDPYRCSCGNRPERPSRGHKWNPVEQKWGGKGHKQKGASGQTSTVASAAKTTAVGKTQVSEWQKLPSQLLDAFCRKEKRPQPKYKSLDVKVKPGGGGGGGASYKYRVIIQDAKVTKRGGDNDFIFIPKNGVHNEEQAKEESALLALLHLTPSLPHERKLPEPYKTTWINAISAMKENEKQQRQQTTKRGANANDNTKENNGNGDDSSNSGDKKQAAVANNNFSGASASSNLVQERGYTSMAQKRQQMDEKKKARSERIRKHEAMRLANRDAQVYMSAQIRKQIESFLRGDVDEELLNALTTSNDGDESSDDDEEEEYDDNDDEDIVKIYVMVRLTHEGFSKRQAKTSYLATMKNPSITLLQSSTNEDRYMDKVYEECLQWLCIHLNEDQLPEGFDPRGRTLEVLMPTKKGAKKDSSTGSSDNEANNCDENTIPEDVIELTKTYGLTTIEATLISKSVAATVTSTTGVRDLLWRGLIDAANVKDKIETNYDLRQELSPDDFELNEQISKDEIEVLQSMFVIGEDLSIRQSDGEVELCITVPPMDDPESNEKKILHIFYSDGLYPRQFPKVFLSGGWKEGCGTFFHINLVKFLASLSEGEPMVFEIFGRVQEMLTENHEYDPSMESLLIPHLEGGKEYLAANARPKQPQSVNKTSTKTGKKSAVKGLMNQKSLNTCRRPREKSFFWSKRPDQTPPAIAFPEISTLMKSTRKRLPAAKARDEFLSVMKMADKNNGVVLVTGETGCGKTTQIPQFILEEAPAASKIVVAQPRRLAATGVADRVAKERGEEKAGQGSVGYVVRGDVAMCNSTRLMFCTTGVLLRQLQSEGALDCISHIVIDEVHERHLDTDILLGILKESKPAHLRVVLMSATMDADRFAGFWGPSTPRMHIPGFTYPVKDFTLEDVLSITGYIPPKNGKKKQRHGYTNRPKKYSPWADSEHSDNDDDNNESPTIEQKKYSISVQSKTNPPPVPIEELIKRVNLNEIDYDLIATLVRHLVEEKDFNDDGSILVFLPGAPEINKAQEAIIKITKATNMKLLPLHGGLQPRDQQRVFERANKGTTKVILSTNVAETSITIPDCTMVIDTCKEKQSSYDPSNRMPLLIETFASQDSLKQRRGRAGRVRPGTCYKLISRDKFNKLPEHGEPEIKRCALDQTLLSLVFLGIERSSGAFLSTLLDPPSQTSIDAAIYSLLKLGAINFSPKENILSLTPLGMHLAAIPAAPCVAKMMVMGAMLGCRYAALAIAAGMSVGRSPFLRINNFKKQQNEADEKAEKQEMKDQMILQERKKLFDTVGNSDLVLLAAAYMKWDSMKGGNGNKRQFCESLGLAINGIRDMKQMVNQLDASLSAAGFPGSVESDQNVNSWRIIRSCIVSSLAPAQIVRVQRASTKYTETVEGAVKKQGDAKELKFYTRGENCSDGNDSSNIIRKYHGVPEERVFIHPSSANFSVGDYSCPWIVYHELVRTNKPYLRDANECNIYDLLLFGGSLEVSSADGTIVIDNYVRLSANARIGALVAGLRRKVDEILSQKVMKPKLDIAKSVEMKLIVKLLRTDGLGR